MRHIFVRGRTEVHIGFWKPICRELHATRLLRIGTDHEAGELSPDTLGFDEVDFNYFIHIENNDYICFNLKDVKTITHGCLLRFDQKNRFLGLEPLPPLKPACRPTPIVLNTRRFGKVILMLGGLEDNSASQLYSLRDKKWLNTPRMTFKHRENTTVACSWKDEAVFTFYLDHFFNIHSSVMDFVNGEFTGADEPNASQMNVALDWQQTDHKMTRL